jgi:hypothetical protein
MCKTCGCKDAESFDAEEYLDGEKCVDCKTETIYIVKNTPKDLSYLMCFTCGSEHFSDKLYFAESFGAERVYDKYQVYVINPDGTEDLYGEYESYQDAEADIESDGELDYYIIEKKLSSSPIHKFGAESFGAENNTKFELLGSKYIEGVGIVTEGSPYLKNYYGEMDEYNIYDDDAAEIIMSIPMNDARFPLKGGEIELIRAMVYGFEHPRINDSWGELNEDGMFWTTKVMETLANYDSSEAESFEADDCEGCGLPDDGKCDCTLDLEYCTTCDEDVGSKNLRKCNCGGAVCKDCNYCEMCGNNLDAESFEADDDYVIVDRGNYRVRVHKKNLDRFNRSTMHKIHSDKHKEGLMYDEETSRWIPLEAESFSDDKGANVFHSSETFKSSNNNNNIMAAESKFDKLSDKIAKQYRKKGMSAKEAKEIGNKTAYTIGRKKYGKAGMAKKARAGMKAESFEAEEWDFGDDREALRKGDEHSDFNNAWRWIFKTKRREWPKWGQKFYDKYKWTLDDPHWNPQLDAESFEADGDITYVVETIKNNKLISKSKDFNNSKDALKLFKEKTSNKSKDEQIQVMEYRDYGKADNDKGNLFGESIYADEQGVYGAESFDAESFEAEEFYKCKNCDYNVELEVEAVFEGGLCSNCLVKEGFQKEYGTHGKWMKNGEYAKKIKGATYEDYDAESFEAQGNPDKRTTTQYAKFYVGFEDDEGELRGGGKFKKYNDAVSQAKIVSKREGNSRVVSTRGFALWTDDGKGMFQEGYDKTVAKEFYSAEGYSIGSGFRLGFGLGLGMLALSTVTTIVALAASTIDERQVEK